MLGLLLIVDRLLRAYHQETNKPSRHITSYEETKMISRFTFIASLASVARGSQPGAPAPVAAPMRDLEWGQLNLIHTTDTHGWLSGHLKE